MDILNAVILGLVEGFTEFLPVSSTGHMILVSDILSLPNTDFLKSFEIGIQLGAIFAIVIMYAPKFIGNIRLYKRLFVAFLPSALFGFVLYPYIKTYLFSPLIVSVALVVGGIFLIILDHMFKKTAGNERQLEDISYINALLIGLFQTFSIIPGVSRAAATITGGLFRGLSKKQAVEFSFLLAVPTMLAATGYDLIKTSSKFSSYEFGLIGIGSIVAFISAWIAVRLFINIINKHGLAIFGYYRIALGVIYLVYFQ